MTNFDVYFNKQMEDPEFRAEYEALQPEFAFIQAMIDAREQSGITQKQLSEVTGIAQGDISKVERGIGNPSLRTLKRIANGLGMRLRVELVPISNR